jgi:ribose-phosphate pyrophosphokinase
MNIIGEVEGRTCVIMDDMVDTAGTLCKAAQALKDHGAAKVLAYCTHPVLSGSAVRAHRRLGAGRTGGDRHHPAARGGRACARIRQISIAELLAETMLRISNEESVSSLFMEYVF